MIRIGLTGGIGSGKSTVARVLELLGVPVYYADARGRWLSDHDPEVVRKVRAIFGQQAYLPDGTMDRKYIAGRVFGDSARLAELNAVIHPAVREDYRRWTEMHAEAACTVIESAILLESGFAAEVDKIIAVVAPEPLRVARVMRRDGVDEAAVRARIAAQMSDEQRAARADYVLRADERELLIPQIVDRYRRVGIHFASPRSTIKQTAMKEHDQHSALTEENTNLYPIYPDIDTKISANKTVDEGELVQENDILNPDPDSLDRG